MPAMVTERESRGDGRPRRTRRLAALLALLVAVAALAASAWAVSSLRSGSSPSSWEPKVWPPTAVASGRVHCDKVASPRGSDRNRGTRGAPYRSAQRLADALTPGQTGCLRDGEYGPSSDYVLGISRSGRRGAPITIRSYPGERARLTGITQVAGRARWITLSGLDFEGDGSQNTIKIYGNDVTVEHSDITNRQRGLSCVILGSPDQGTAERPLLKANRLHDCGNPANGNKDHAIYAAYTADGRITGNYFANSAAYAIQFYPSAQHLRFDRNVVDGGGDSIRGGVVFGGDSGHASSGNLVDHNVIAFAATFGITSEWEGPTGTGNTVRANCLWKSGQGNTAKPIGFQTAANVVADPEFRDRDRGDYRMPSDNRCGRVLR